MKKFLALFNVRTWITLAIALMATFFTIHYNFQIHHNFLLLGLLIVFPVVKSFQFAFKRRERALEYLSVFRGGLTTVNQFFQHAGKLSPENKVIGRDMIIRTSDVLINYLKTRQPGIKEVYAQLDQVSVFLQQHHEEIGGKTVSLIIRYMREVQVSTTYLISLTRHRTVLFLRMLALAFINIFPLIHAPLMNNMFSEWPGLIYVLTSVTGLVLITLYNVQYQLENPFDERGYDDIKLEDFRVML